LRAALFARELTYPVGGTPRSSRREAVRFPDCHRLCGPGGL